MHLRDLPEYLLDLFFPPRCPFCRAILKDHEKLICDPCRRTLPLVPEHAQRQTFRHVDSCFSPLYYEGTVRRSLLRYKFGSLQIYAKAYAALMTDCLETNGADFDLITWVPLGAKRLRKRGYDQARLLAKGISDRTGVPYERLLVKTADNPPQSGTGSPEKRKKNVAGVYRPADPSRIKGKRILLVDDIVTTGATVGECARVLKAAGAMQICAAAVARSKHT